MYCVVDYMINMLEKNDSQPGMGVPPEVHVEVRKNQVEESTYVNSVKEYKSQKL